MDGWVGGGRTYLAPAVRRLFHGHQQDLLEGLAEGRRAGGLEEVFEDEGIDGTDHAEAGVVLQGDALEDGQAAND